MLGVMAIQAILAVMARLVLVQLAEIQAILAGPVMPAVLVILDLMQQLLHCIPATFKICRNLLFTFLECQKLSKFVNHYHRRNLFNLLMTQKLYENN